ncbi:MAG: nucleotidyltransferase domain-containing protein [Planctomycetes bacterium]|nr:nucleotidyltransferase domain-containing protein [Planctomycetota bacterium]
MLRPVSMEDLVEAWRKRAAAAQETRLAAFRDARDAALRAAAVLRERFGARRVVLFGSALLPERFDPARSDLDLAVEGLPWRRYFEAIEAVRRAAEPFRVDLKEIEVAPQELRESIEAEGLVLHESRA